MGMGLKMRREDGNRGREEEIDWEKSIDE